MPNKTSIAFEFDISGFECITRNGRQLVKAASGQKLEKGKYRRPCLSVFFLFISFKNGVPSSTVTLASRKHRLLMREA